MSWPPERNGWRAPTSGSILANFEACHTKQIEYTRMYSKYYEYYGIRKIQLQWWWASWPPKMTSKMYFQSIKVIEVAYFSYWSTYRVISTLIGWNRIVSLGCLANGTKNTTIENNECQYRNESQSHRVGNQHIIPGILQIFTEFRGCYHGIFDLFGDVRLHIFIENSVVLQVEFRPKFKESWDVENDTGTWFEIITIDAVVKKVKTPCHKNFKLIQEENVREQACLQITFWLQKWLFNFVLFSQFSKLRSRHGKDVVTKQLLPES